MKVSIKSNEPILANLLTFEKMYFLKCMIVTVIFSFEFFKHLWFNYSLVLYLFIVFFFYASIFLSLVAFACALLFTLIIPSYCNDEHQLLIAYLLFYLYAFLVFSISSYLIRLFMSIFFSFYKRINLTLSMCVLVSVQKCVP